MGAAASYQVLLVSIMLPKSDHFVGTEELIAMWTQACSPGNADTIFVCIELCREARCQTKASGTQRALVTHDISSTYLQRNVNGIDDIQQCAIGFIKQ
jgi:hypothetical protein